MYSCDISGDSAKMVCTYGDTIHVWNLLTGKEIKSFPKELMRSNSVILCPDAIGPDRIIYVD